jgi:hypothetical protein
MSRRGCSLPANASGFDPHRASISSRFGQAPASSDSAAPLELKGQHKLQVLYSGSIILQHNQGGGGGESAQPPGNGDAADRDEIRAATTTTGGGGGHDGPHLASPDGGCVCFVLRTGKAGGFQRTRGPF